MQRFSAKSSGFAWDFATSSFAAQNCRTDSNNFFLGTYALAPGSRANGPCGWRALPGCM